MGAEPCTPDPHTHVGVCARAGYRLGYDQALADVESLAETEETET